MTSTLARKTGKVKVDDRLVLNIGGQRYDTYLTTLARYPFTRLGELSQSQHLDASWDNARGEYFFDRHGPAFASILQYYRTGEFHPDHNLCGNLMKMELEFWAVSEVDIESCCWGNYSRFRDHKETLSALDDNFEILDYPESDGPPPCWQLFKRNVWRFLEDPSSSLGAKLFAVLAMFFVCLSILSFVLETHDWFRVLKPGHVLNETAVLSQQGGREGSECCCTKKIDEDFMAHSTPHLAMYYIDLTCAAYFTLEFFIRLFFAPNKFRFIKELLNIIDFICLIPYYVNFGVSLAESESEATERFRVVIALRTVRVLRIFKIMKHYTAFKILVYTLKVSTKELALIIVFLFTGVLIFASVIYYVENPPFTSIPIGFWWALVTMTTVGYGDRVPLSEWGYVVGSVCVLCGVLTIAFTVPIVVNNFTMYYSHAQSRIRLPAEKRSEIKKRNLRKSEIKKESRSRGKVGVMQSVKEETRDSHVIKVQSYDNDSTSTSTSSAATQTEDVKVKSETETLTISEQKSHVIKTSWTRQHGTGAAKPFKPKPFKPVPKPKQNVQ